MNNKILYEQSTFYLLQEGKKIKIDNPELLKEFRHADIIGYSDAKEWDSFDLPKELSVEVKEACGYDSCPVDAGCEHCKEPIEVAILSKSSSPEIPDSSEHDLKESIEILKRHNQWRRGGDEDMTHPKRLGQAIDVVVRHLESPRTVAGTSTEQYVDFIDGSTYVKPSDSEKPNNSEKPDFNEWIKSDIGKECSNLSNLKEQKYLDNRLFWAFDAGRDCVWAQYIEQKKTISDLRERVKQADDLFNCVKQNQDVIPSWMKEAYENYAKGKR